MRRSNGSGTISKYKGRRKPWRVLAPQSEDPETGRMKRPVIGYYSTRKEAETALARFNASPYLIASDMTFAGLFEQWINHKEALGKSPQTIASYKAAFKRCASIADRPVRKLKLIDLIEVFEANSDAGKSTVNNIKIVIDGVFEDAERYEYIGRNYARLIRTEDMVYNTPAEPKHKIFTLDEVRAVMTAPRDVFTDCTKILLYSGFRVEELLSMERPNIHTDKLYFEGGLKTKAGKGRIVPIHHEITPLVREYYAAAQTKIFPIDQSRLRKAMSERWGHIPHDTRHTFISRLQTLRADKLCIERIVGHATTNITDKVYTHKELPELRKCIEMLEY